MPFQFRKEAVEEDLNSNFPSQGQGNPPLYYSLSEVVVPTYSINQSAEGSVLPERLQQAYDFSVGFKSTTSATPSPVVINNTGFWIVWGSLSFDAATQADIYLNDGVSTKTLYQWRSNGANPDTLINIPEFVVFLRSGDTLEATNSALANYLNLSYRQIAEINGDLVDPLGYSAA